MLNYHTQSQVRQVVRYIILLAIALVMFVPILWMFVSSIRPPGSIFEYTRHLSWQTFFPSEITWENYEALFASTEFVRALLNTTFVSVVTAVLGVVINSLAGFAFAVFSFRGKNALFAIVLITFMMPFESIVIPLYTLIEGLGWVNTYQALIVPAVFNGLIIFLFRQFLAGIPTEIYEATRIDGATWWQVYTEIAMPLAWPTIVTALLMMFIQQWEAFFWPLVAANSPDYVMLQVAIARNINFEQTAWGTLFSSTAIATLVPMALYLTFQKQYTRSIVSSAFK